MLALASPVARQSLRVESGVAIYAESAAAGHERQRGRGNSCVDTCHHFCELQVSRCEPH